MNQRQRSQDDQRAHEAENEASAGSARLGSESGIAPKADGAADGDETLYERLLRSGAFDEVMEAASQQAADDARPTPVPTAEPHGERHSSMVVPKGAAPRTTDELDVVDLELVGPPSVPAVARSSERDDLVEAQRFAEQVDDDADDDVNERPTLPTGTQPSLRSDEDDTPVRLPINKLPPPLPSVMLSPEALPQAPNGSTMRVVLEDTPATAAGPATVRVPVQAAPKGESQGESRWLLAVVVLLSLVAGALLFWLVSRPGEPSAPAQAVAPKPVPVPVPEAPAPVVEPPPAPEQEEPAPTKLEEVEVRMPSEPVAPEPAEPAPRARRKARTPAPARVEAAEPAPAPTPAPEPAGDRPSREQVIEVMNGLAPTLRECAAGVHGDTRLTLTVRSTGKVSYALVQGAFEGSEAGSCMARAARELSFPPFSDPMFRVTYPFRL